MNYKTMLLATAVAVSTAVASQANTANFGGFYMGANAGMTRLSSGFTDSWAVAGDVVKKKNDSAFVGGGHLGYGAQMSGPVYLGAEFGVTGASATAKATVTNTGVVTENTKMKSGIGYDLTARLGYVAGSAMPYLRFGYAARKFKIDSNFPAVPAAIHFKGKTLGGWRVGLGVDYKMTDSFAMGLEGNYTRYQKTSARLIAPAVNTEVFKVRPAELDGKVRFTYHFGK